MLLLSRQLEASGLKRKHWSTVTPIHTIFRDAFTAAGYLAYDRWIRQESLPERLIHSNGRIESDHVTIAGNFAGRIKNLIVREGHTLKERHQVLEVDLPQQLACVSENKAEPKGSTSSG
jgi:hypothetical protein